MKLRTVAAITLSGLFAASFAYAAGQDIMTADDMTGTTTAVSGTVGNNSATNDMANGSSNIGNSTDSSAASNSTDDVSADTATGDDDY